ncbi:hypothetical protein FNF27_02489 [Cafeteria roenbergensis]|uniref:Fibronectin type-III domain-containing protein n=1 Tax=Cafeteria roenbergensis TaxID=33653 RepID=A0A5A8E3F9_CAFRO|nr:hypothetical protein FNF28_00020 [Cafeteria roenbergensis]KAA0176100.1 hypothetical protein FNF27_02489 [Cafeteria roenbergensis]
MAGAAGPVGRLLKAADKGDEDTLKRLLQSGTDANAWDAAGWTALMKASLSGHKRIVNLLLTADRPAQPMTANKLGKTALHYACMGGHHAIAQVLLMYGADPFAKDSEQSTPLDDAAANGHDHIIAQMQMRLPEIRLPSVPDPPRLQLSTVDMLEVRWDPPADDEPDGPRRVEAYGLQLARIEGGRMPSGEAAWRTVGRRVASRHCRIRGLRPGHAFVTRVAASNKFGWGRWSEASEVMWTLTAEEAAAAGGSSSLREALREANEERRLAETKAASLELQLRKSGRRADAADDRLKVYRADRRALRSLDTDVLTALETELERAIAGVRAEKNDRVRKVLAGQDDVD